MIICPECLLLWKNEWNWCELVLPSGNLTNSYGKWHFLMGKSTISTGPFSIAMLPEGKTIINPPFGNVY